ncbi:MAG TPA: hypothetical protein VFZ65_22595 [Planctomycetota bacterium]|nr:hypothetical protein [Planctomycetota bacterium]
MKAEERLREAWLEAALEEELGGAPDLTQALMAAADEGVPVSEGPVRPRALVVATFLLGAAAVAVALLTSRGGAGERRVPVLVPAPVPRPAPLQEPVAGRLREVVPTTVEELRQLLGGVGAARLSWQYRTSYRDIAAASAGIDVQMHGWLTVPEMAAEIALHELTIGEAASPALRAPARASMCDLLLADGSYVRGYVGLGEGAGALAVFGTPRLSPQVLAGAGWDELVGAAAALDERARNAFALTQSIGELAAASDQTEVLVCAGVDDDGLQQLARFPKLRNVVVSTRQDHLQRVPMLADLPVLGRHFEARAPAVAVSDRGLLPLAGCRCLESVTLIGAAATDEAIARLAALPKLHTLRVLEGDAAKLTGAGLAPFAGRTLRAVELEQCPGIDDAGLATIGRSLDAGELRVVFANDNVTRDGLRALLGAVRASTLTIDGIELDHGTFDLPRQAPLLRTLAELRLRHATIDLSGLANFLALRDLSLAECRLPAGALSAVAQSRLASLTIDRCAKPVVEDVASAIQLPSLRRLTLSNLRAWSDWEPVLAGLANARRLVALDLSGNDASGGDLLPGLLPLSWLEQLDLRGNRLSEDDQQRLGTALAATRIRWPEAERTAGRRR